MDYIVFLRWLHVLGACVLIGTGIGIAFFMLMANRTRQATLIAHTAGVVVAADIIFTATAVVVQPITGVLLAGAVGWSLTEGWIVLSVALYVVIGLCWIPVVLIQIKLRDLAVEAALNGKPLPVRYDRLYVIWFSLGVPAFIAILAIVWLMLAKPQIAIL